MPPPSRPVQVGVRVPENTSMQAAYPFRRSVARGLAVCQGVIGYVLFVGFIHGVNIGDFIGRHESRSVAIYALALISVVTHAALLVQALWIRWSRAWQLLSWTVGATLAFDLGLGTVTFSPGQGIAVNIYYSALFVPMSLIFLGLRPWRNT